MSDDEPTIDEVRQWETENPWDDDAIPSRLLRALLRRLEREAETPSEAVARKALSVVGETNTVLCDREGRIIYDPETVALVERLREHARKWEWDPVLGDADAWLAKRRT